VGTASFVDPFIWPKLVDGLREYMERHRLARLTEVIGTLRPRRPSDDGSTAGCA
jgi:hypothetical protein